MIKPMRITLDIDADVLESVEELVAQRGTIAGRVLSELVRIALAPRGRSSRKRNGVPLLQKNRRARIVTPGIVNRLRDRP